MAVLGGHMISHGGMLAGAGVGTLNSFVCAFLLGAFMSLTNFFGMMSGYLLCKSRFKLRRILSIWLQVVFYSVLFTVPRLFYARGEVGLQEFVSMFLPVTCKRVWYVSCYVAVVLLAPFINRLLARALAQAAPPVGAGTARAVQRQRDGGLQLRRLRHRPDGA